MTNNISARLRVAGLLTGICSLVLLSAQLQAQSTDQAAERPNFLLFTTDDMGYNDLGAFGGFDIPTPNIDTLALQGVRLTNFHTAPSCGPTRSMLMSGTGNHEAGMGAQRLSPEFEGHPGYEGYLPERVLSLPERLQAAGYHTYMAGKWHLGSEEGVNHPNDRGFERSFALMPGSSDHYNPSHLDELPYSEDGHRVESLPEDFYTTTAYVDKLISYLQSNESSDRPFFAWFAPTAPHWPLQVAPGWEDKFAGQYEAGYEALCQERLQGMQAMGVLPEDSDSSRCSEEAERWESLTAEEKRLNSRAMELYAAMTSHLDTEFGRLLAYLEESGQLENTYIIYHNDNGPQGGEIITARSAPARYNNDINNIGQRDSWIHLGQGWSDAQSAPFRQDKGAQFEGGIRVPAFIRPPQPDTARGEISNSLLTVMDVMPTIMELAGIEERRTNASGQPVLPIRGKSFAPLLHNTGQPIHQDEYIALDSEGESMLIHNQWKIVRQPLASQWTLFNTQDDPSETRDLAASHPEILSDLVAKYEAHAQEVGIIKRVPRAATGLPGGMGGMGAP